VRIAIKTIKDKVVDTNILLQSEDSPLRFQSDDPETLIRVWVPLPVLQELDNFKSEKTDRGYTARRVLRLLMSDLRKEHEGNLSEGIRINDNYVIQGLGTLEPLQDSPLNNVVADNNDGKILKLTYHLAGSEQDVELITNDFALIAQAEALGLNSNIWRGGEAVRHGKELYKGWREIIGAPSTMLDKLFDPRKMRHIPLERLVESGLIAEDDLLMPNEYVVLKGGSGGSALARFDPHYGGLVRLKDQPHCKVRPKGGVEQAFAIDALLEPSIDFLCLIGNAGTGKTYLSTVLGYYQVMEKPSYKGGLLLMRPVVEMANQIGFLPGREDEKLRPWMMPFYDNLKQLTDIYDETSPDDLREYEATGFIEIQNLSSIRGRTFTKKLVVLDEGQNINQNQAKTVITRMGEGSKLIVTGDPDQIDEKGLTKYNNGVVFLSERLKKADRTATIVFDAGNCVRSPLVQEALRYI